MWGEFKEFAMRGNVLDMAFGIMMGGAFTPIAASLVNDIFMPPIGLLLGEVEFKDLFLVLRSGEPAAPYRTLADAQAAGAVTIAYGQFANTVLTFLIVAFAVFLMVRGVNRMRRRQEGAGPKEPTVRKCPYCLSDVPARATRCAYCASDLSPVT